MEKMDDEIAIPRFFTLEGRRLSPYSPELNPCEQLWDLIKDALGNRVFQSMEELRTAMLPVLESWWTLPERILSLVGRTWLRS